MVNAPTGAPGTGLTVMSRPTAVDPGTATVPVRLGFTRAIDIPVGTPVQVDIAAEQHRDVVIVPTAAVVREGDETAAFVVSEGKAQRRPIQIGLTDDANVEIVSGIAAGDRVIVDGQAGLPDDAPVTEAAPAGKEAAPAGKRAAPAGKGAAPAAKDGVR
jgi:hypothetical protein